jgi:hypothetical protein
MSTLLTVTAADLMDLSIAAKDYFVDAYQAYPMPFTEYFDIQYSTLKADHISQMSGLTAPAEVGENGDFPEVTPTEGYDVTATHLQYAQSLPISRILQADDPKGVYTRLETHARSHVKAMQQKACILASTLLTGSMATVGPDGQYLVDTDHPTSPANATTLSNKITTKLDAGGLAVQEMITKISTNGKDMAGNQILFNRWKLVVPPALHSNALKSCVALYGTPFAVSNVGVYSGVVGGASNPTPVQTGAIFRQNTYSGATIEVVQDPFIGSGYSGGSDVKWYMIASPMESAGFHSLRWTWREEPQVLPVWQNQVNKALHLDGVMRCSAVAIDFRHIWGSDGTV